MASRLLTATRVRELARRYGIKPSRSLGQNFVVDPNTIRRVVRLAGVGPADRILEVGAGLGTLTMALAGAAAEVIAIELDRSLVPALEEVTEGAGGVRVLVADAMTLDYPGLLRRPPYRLVSNLPYNLATPLLATLLTSVPQIADFVVMVQREVGERLIAEPGSKTYGAVSVLVAYHAQGRLLGRVPPTVFWPKPRVESVIIALSRRSPPVDVAASDLMVVVRAAFSQRRKTVRNALASALGRSAAEVEGLLVEAGIDPKARAEKLSIQDFAQIHRALRDHRKIL